MSLFLYLADQIVGTNVSGLNGSRSEFKLPPGYVAISESEFDRANKAISDLHELSQKQGDIKEQNQALQKDLKRWNEKIQSYESKLKELENKSRLYEEWGERLIEQSGNESTKISATYRGMHFVQAQFKALSKKFGFENSSRSFLKEKLDINQRFTFNIYIIAAADYKMLEIYLGSIVAAMTEVIDELKKINGDDNESIQIISQLSQVREALLIDLVNFTRLDSDIFKSFHSARVKEIAEKARFKKSGDDYEFDPDSVPPVSKGTIDEALSNLGAISAIKERIKDNDVRDALRVEDDEMLIPSSIHTEQFGIRSYVL